MNIVEYEIPGSNVCEVAEVDSLSIVYNGGPDFAIKFFVGDEQLVVNLHADQARTLQVLITSAFARSYPIERI